MADESLRHSTRALHSTVLSADFQVDETLDVLLGSTMSDELEYECEHDSPSATFYYSDGGPQGDSEFPHTICMCGHDDTEGDFITEWISTDAWRGHLDVKPDKGSRWVEVHDDG